MDLKWWKLKYLKPFITTDETQRKFCLGAIFYGKPLKPVLFAGIELSVIKNKIGFLYLTVCFVTCSDNVGIIENYVSNFLLFWEIRVKFWLRKQTTLGLGKYNKNTNNNTLFSFLPRLFSSGIEHVKLCLSRKQRSNYFFQKFPPCVPLRELPN